MESNLQLNLKSVLNIYDDYQSELKEVQLKLCESREKDEKFYSEYISLLSSTKNLILDIRIALSLIQCDNKNKYIEELDEIKYQCSVYEKNGNKIVDIYNDIYNKSLLLNNSKFASHVLSEILIIKDFFEKVKNELQGEYIKIAKYIIDKDIKKNKLVNNNTDIFI